MSTKHVASVPPPPAPAPGAWGGDVPPEGALFVEIAPGGPAPLAANACDELDGDEGPDSGITQSEPGPRPEGDAGGPEGSPIAAAQRSPQKRRGAKPLVSKPCPCYQCCHHPGHPEEGYHRDLRMLLGHLGESQRRWVAALEARRLGFGGTRIVARITGLDEKTVRRGRRELDAAFVDVPSRRLRRPPARRPAGGGSGPSA